MGRALKIKEVAMELRQGGMTREAAYEEACKRVYTTEGARRMAKRLLWSEWKKEGRGE